MHKHTHNSVIIKEKSVHETEYIDFQFLLIPSITHDKTVHTSEMTCHKFIALHAYNPCILSITET